ncbi:MAG: riboflavin synthase [Candidatus Gastranaerophilales bacterium]|nr:riboflavin synthase [Candidatus Gastranaerophilales bacterium]
MFTGIVEEIGTVKIFSKQEKNALIVVECKKILEGTKIGDSIAINGVCQTVTEIFSNTFSAQVSSETLSVTNLANLKAGDKVNLERALMLNSRLGGHIVTGHIDGLAKIKSIQNQSEFYNVKFEAGKYLGKYIVKKGSVAINGISLTIADVVLNEFSVAVIPHTFENTVLKFLKTGDFVNIEVDVLAKYVEKFLSREHNSTIDENFLKENGFF